MPSAEQSECVVESIDKIDGVVPCSFSVRGNLPRKVRALDRDRGDKPGGQSSQRKKGNSENKSHGFRTAERPARHSRHQRVEQISKNHGDGYGDQDRLEEANDVGCCPDRCADNDDEKNHEAGSKCCPHRLTLPWRRIFLHVRWTNAQLSTSSLPISNDGGGDRPPRTLTLDICRVAAQRTLRCLMFGVGRAHYVGFVFTGKSLPIVFLVPSIFPARFLFFGSSASAFCHDSNASGTRFNFK